MNDVVPKVDAAVMPIASQETINELQLQVQQLSLASELANCYCGTALVPAQFQGNPHAGAVAIQWGMELGIKPLQALQNIAVIHNIPSIWGDMLVAIVLASPLCEELDVVYDSDTHTAKATTKRAGMKEKHYSYSREMAGKAGLLNNDKKQAWKRHEQRMLENRARSLLLRNVYPDLLKGFQIRECVEEDFAGMKDVTPTKSNTLNTLLDDTVSDEIKEIEDRVLLAESKEQFEQTKTIISALQDGPQKERLKVLWLRMCNETHQVLKGEGDSEESDNG